MKAQPYSIGPNEGDSVSLLGRDACNIQKDGTVFYAGRAEQLPAFLDGMRSTCPGNYPKMLTDDDSVRFLRTGQLSNFPGLTLEYLSFASSLAFGPKCADASAIVQFFADYGRTFGDDKCIRTRDSYFAILAYDAFRVFTRAAQNTKDPHPSRDAILGGIKEISGAGAYSGASGLIDFPRDGSAQSVPKDKVMLILQATGNAEPNLLLLCGQVGKVAQGPKNNCIP